VLDADSWDRLTAKQKHSKGEGIECQKGAKSQKKAAAGPGHTSVKNRRRKGEVSPLPIASPCGREASESETGGGSHQGWWPSGERRSYAGLARLDNSIIGKKNIAGVRGHFGGSKKKRALPYQSWNKKRENLGRKRRSGLYRCTLA